MMKDCWDTYVKYGFGSNEVDVVKKRGIDRIPLYQSIKGLTIIDSLDTLLIMGLYPEYLVGRNWIENKLEFSSGQYINLFESNIRVFGGLLSTYYLTKDQVHFGLKFVIPR
ncbi:Mannosyl-oligosaccharide 1,2-alpha-mannosidase IB [Thelohanellus kitauei]|uniref:alpha-1,2-Mannosidase n=1 Tax=Thelohanellus kitauei TaxID=669202 RepID=A0A0C2MKE3_THEKT|nr:Mannosyl-oligosaccharide 1,2-alpha-mannosidase IB [Thelohanellus kitauei]